MATTATATSRQRRQQQWRLWPRRGDCVNHAATVATAMAVTTVMPTVTTAALWPVDMAATAATTLSAAAAKILRRIFRTSLIEIVESIVIVLLDVGTS